MAVLQGVSNAFTQVTSRTAGVTAVYVRGETVKELAANKSGGKFGVKISAFERQISSHRGRVG